MVNLSEYERNTYLIGRMGVLPFSLFLPYIHFVVGHLMGRGGDGGQKMLGTPENEHKCSILRVVV